MGRELGVGDIEQQEIGVPACGQLDRARRRDTCAISGDQNEVAEYDLALHKVQPRSTLGRADVPVRWTICGLTSGYLMLWSSSTMRTCPVIRDPSLSLSQNVS